MISLLGMTKKQLLTSPNFYSLLRVFLVIPLALFFYFPIKHNNLYISLFFIMAALTDFIDGRLARYYGSVSKFGAFIDPVADKILTSVAFILLVEKFSSNVITIPVIILIIRELSISGLREWMAELNKRAVVKVSYAGKLKVFAQAAAIAFLFFTTARLESPDIWLTLGIVCIYLAAILSVSSVIKYFIAAYNHFEL